MQSEIISAMFGHDPSNLVAVSGPYVGLTLHEVCCQFNCSCETHESGARKYRAPDGTCITQRNDGWWDYGFESCWCWDTEGHNCQR